MARRTISLGISETGSSLFLKVDHPLSDDELQRLFVTGSPFPVEREFGSTAGWPWGNLAQNSRGIQVLGFDADIVPRSELVDYADVLATKIGAVVIEGVSTVSLGELKPDF